MPALAACVLALAGSAWGRQPQPANPPAPATAPAPAAAQPAPAARPAPARSDEDTTELVIQLRDGRRFTGPVVRQNAKEVVIRIAGVDQPFATEDIEKVETLPPLMERYRTLREAVGEDPDQIERLAEWLQQHGKYELALLETNRALAIDKSHGPSLRLKAVLEQQIVLKQKRLEGQEAPRPDAPLPAPAPRGPEFPILAQPEINLIKVYETNFDEHPRVLIPRQAVQKMLEQYTGNPLVPITREGREALLRESPANTLKLMFAMQARDFYSQVEVLDQPRSFVVFRDHVCRTWLINSCSTSACHGGMEAGRLILRNREPNAERTVYTNFLILSRYHMEDGTPIIDWEQPERSVLLQMGLPRDKSRRPHPAAPRGVAGKDAFKPVFRNAEDPQFKQAVEWIKTLYRPRPEYPIVYTPLRPLEIKKPDAQPPAAPAPAVPAAPAPGPGGAAPDAQPKADPGPTPTTDKPATPTNEPTKAEPRPR